MKKITLATMAVILTCVFSTPAFAAVATQGPYQTSASVDDTLSLEVKLFKNSVTPANLLPAGSGMNFGKLVDIGTGTLRSSATSTTGIGSVIALVTANSHGKPYTIKQTGVAMTDGANVLPAGACGVAVNYQNADNGGNPKPGTLTLRTPNTWVGTDLTLASDSSTSSQMSTLQMTYSITDDPSGGALGGASVPLNQKTNGNPFVGSVTFTVTA